MNNPAPQSEPKKDNRTLYIILAILFALICFCLLVAGSSWFLLRDRIDAWLAALAGQTSAPSASGAAPVSQYPLARDNSIGDPNAPIRMVVYSDYQCPFCRRFHDQVLPQIMSNYVETGKVYLTYRSMGDFLGPESGLAAQAAYCAGDQGMFWDYSDMLFANQTGENVGNYTRDNLVRFAGYLSLDPNAFEACLSNGKYANRVQRDFDDGLAAGVQGTPSSLVNDQLFEGAQPYDVFQPAFDALLGQ